MAAQVKFSLSDQRGLRGRLAVVTGGGGGIGRAISLRLAQEGATILVTDRDLASAEVGAAAIRDMGGSASSLEVDVTKPSHIKRLSATWREGQLGRPTVVVSCAGLQTFTDVLDVSTEDWDRVMDVNAKGALLVLQAAARAMGNAGGSIVTVASLQARLGSRYYAPYSASKAAVLSLTRSFAVALAAQGIRVNAVAPGIVDAGLWELADAELARLRGVSSGVPRQERIAQVPLGRAGTPDDVASAVAFLASDDASYITGECLHVCGGDLML